MAFFTPLPLCHTLSFFCPNYGTTDGIFCFVHLADYANQVMKKEAEKMRNHNFSYWSHLFLHTDRHVLTIYTGKEEKILLPELISKQHFKHFKTVIFNLFCTENLSDHNLLGLFPLLHIVKSSELHHAREKKKPNYRRHEHRKKN